MGFHFINYCGKIADFVQCHGKSIENLRAGVRKAVENHTVLLSHIVNCSIRDQPRANQGPGFEHGGDDDRFCGIGSSLELEASAFGSLRAYATFFNARSTGPKTKKRPYESSRGL